MLSGPFGASVQVSRLLTTRSGLQADSPVPVALTCNARDVRPAVSGSRASTSAARHPTGRGGVLRGAGGWVTVRSSRRVASDERCVVGRVDDRMSVRLPAPRLGHVAALSRRTSPLRRVVSAVAGLVAGAMVLTGLVLPPAATAASLPAVDTTAPVAADPLDAVSAMVTAQAQGSRVEDLAARTQSTSSFANPDGTWTVDDFGVPVRFQDAAQAAGEGLAVFLRAEQLQSLVNLLVHGTA